MIEQWVSQVRGHDSNPGTKEKPFASIPQALATYVLDATIWIESGIYRIPRSYYFMSNKSFIGIGEVVWDSEGYNEVISTLHNAVDVYFSNITFRNFVECFQYGSNVNTAAGVYAYGCTFEKIGTYYKYYAGTFISRNTPTRLSNCLFYGFDGINDGTTFGCDTHFIDCLLHDTPAPSISCAYCAGSASDVYSAIGGINSSSVAPPFTDISTPNDPDLTYDKDHANYGAYANGGKNSACVGVIGKVCMYWPQKAEVVGGEEMVPAGHIGSDSAYLLGKWANYEHYFKSWDPITIVAGVNDSWQYELSGEINVCTIAAGVYDTAALWLNAVQTSFNSSGPNYPFTFEIGSTGKMRVHGVIGSLPPPPYMTMNHGSYNTNDAWTELRMVSGFSTHTTDGEGDTILIQFAATVDIYDYGRQNGDFVNFEYVGSAEVSSSSGSAVIDPAADPSSAKQCCVVSPVIWAGGCRRAKSINVQREVDGAGEVDGSRATSDRTCLVRANAVEFDMQAVPGETDLDWTEVSHNTADIYDIIPIGYDYWQIMLQPRIDSTP